MKKCLTTLVVDSHVFENVWAWIADSIGNIIFPAAASLTVTSSAHYFGRIGGTPTVYDLQLLLPLDKSNARLRQKFLTISCIDWQDTCRLVGMGNSWNDLSNFGSAN